MPEGRRSASLPLVGTRADWKKEEFTLLNKIERIGPTEEQSKTKNQNLPKMENQNTKGALPGLPLVGLAISNTHRKEPAAPPPSSPRFHDHLVLESKPHFMIILRLENAQSGKTWVPTARIRRIKPARL